MVFGPTLAAAVVLSVGIGVSLGLLGGGGSSLTVPILVYVVGLETHHAIAMSLLVVGTTSVTALIPHARAGRVRGRTGAVFGVASMTGAFAAGRVAHLIHPTVLLVAFGAMMLVTSVAMMRGRKASASGDATAPGGPLPYRALLLRGLLVGAATGLVGAGGGFLVVPALLLLGRIPMANAVGTSLLVIALNSFAAFTGHLSTVALDWTVAGMVTGAAVLGSFGGGVLAGKLPPETLRRLFAWFLVVMATFILAQEVPRALGFPFHMREHWGWVLGAVSIPITLAVASLSRGRVPAAAPAR